MAYSEYLGQIHMLPEYYGWNQRSKVRMRYQIQQQLPGGDLWLTICECESPQAVSSVIAAILTHSIGVVQPIKIVTYQT